VKTKNMKFRANLFGPIRALPPEEKDGNTLRTHVVVIQNCFG